MIKVLLETRLSIPGHQCSCVSYSAFKSVRIIFEIPSWIPLNIYSFIHVNGLITHFPRAPFDFTALSCWVQCRRLSNFMVRKRVQIYDPFSWTAFWGSCDLYPGIARRGGTCVEVRRWNWTHRWAAVWWWMETFMSVTFQRLPEVHSRTPAQYPVTAARGRRSPGERIIAIMTSTPNLIN